MIIRSIQVVIDLEDNDPPFNGRVVQIAAQALQAARTSAATLVVDKLESVPDGGIGHGRFLVRAHDERAETPRNTSTPASPVPSEE